jgi:uncharacterized Ntn-hydrolase superfamily protein
VLPGTFTIIARDSATDQLGIAVQSKYLAVGATVPAARAGVGAVATQAWSNPTYGPRGLALLAEGHAPGDVVATLIADDAERSVRQVAVMDWQGRVEVHTGKHCFPWAGSRVDAKLACLGNVLAGPAVVDAMAERFSASEGEFAQRLIDALRAGQDAGGDWRGQESAALLVVRPKADYKHLTDKYIDLRVDRHDDPIEELHELLRLHRDRFRWHEGTTVAVSMDVAMILQVALGVLGYDPGPLTRAWNAQTESALRRFCADRGLSTEGLDTGRIAVRTFETIRRTYATL